MEVQVALFCFITAVMSQQLEGLVKYECVDSSCPEDSLSSMSFCECNRGYHHVPLQCKHCPGLECRCTDCCYPPNMYNCADSRNKTRVIISLQQTATTESEEQDNSEAFMLAAQVALGAALIFAFVALAALLWKACRGRSGSRRHLSGLRRQRESSLTSVQRFVLRRLRDRPPRYEDTNQIRLEKPPPYQEGVTNHEVAGIWSTPPPLYSEALHSATSSTVNEDNKPEQQAHVSMVSDTRTEGEGENGLSHSCQLRGADSIRSTPHADRQTQRSESELHM